MLVAIMTVSLLVAFALASMTYVYAFRGNYRHAGLSEYLRKCWPMFAPLNCLLYLATERRARKAIMELAEFPELERIRANWQIIRDEALELRRQNEFERARDRDSHAYYDVGFHTFFKYGWSKFYLKWYGYTHDSAKRQCPATLRILESIPSIKGAMFTLLPAGSKLTPHSDPFACSLRYHLGLATPNSADCWINIDGISYSWRDGEALLFDETYVHHALNSTDSDRLILMCDLARPMNVFGRAINFCYQGLMRLTIVPNDADDRRGAFSALFHALAPVMKKGKQLKKRNRRLYKLITRAINVALACVLLALLAAVIYVPYSLLAN